MQRDLARRLDRLDILYRRLPPAPAPRTDMDALYRRLEAAGLVYWSDTKQYWSPTDPGDLRLIKALLAERRARGMADDGGR